MPLPLCPSPAAKKSALPPSLPPISPPSLLPLSLGAGAAFQPNPKPSSHLFRAGNERRGSERSPKPADGQIFIIFAQMGPGKPGEGVFKEPLECLIEIAPAQAHPRQAQARAPDSSDLSHRLRGLVLSTFHPGRGHRVREPGQTWASRASRQAPFLSRPGQT